MYGEDHYRNPENLEGDSLFMPKKHSNNGVDGDRTFFLAIMVSVKCLRIKGD